MKSNQIFKIPFIKEIVDMNRKILLLFILLSFCLLVLSGCESDAAEKKLVFQGIIEADEVDINAKIPGRIISLEVEEGTYINKNDVIAIVDSKDLQAKREGLVAQSNAALSGIEAAKAQYQAAVGQVDAANAILNKAKNGARSEEIAKAQANYDIMKKSYDRISSLYENGAVALSQLDEIETKLNVAEQDLKMTKQGARSEDIEAAKGQVAAAKGQAAASQSNISASEEKYAQAVAGISELDTYITDSSIRSPISGYVTSLNSASGEMVSTGMNLATITDIENMYLHLNIDETKLSLFKENNAVKIKTLAYPDEDFSGKIIQVNKKADFAIKKASNENGEFDLVSFFVKIKVENPKNLLRPGMTGFVDLDK